MAVAVASEGLRLPTLATVSPRRPAGGGQRRLGRASARRPGTDPSPPLRAWPRGDAQALRPHLFTAPFKPGPRGRKAGRGQARWHTWGAAVTCAVAGAVAPQLAAVARPAKSVLAAPYRREMCGWAAGPGAWSAWRSFPAAPMGPAPAPA